MQIKNLSSAQTFGTVIASLPDDMPCTSHCCVRAGEPIKEWLSQEPVVLDYVSGMRCPVFSHRAGCPLLL